MLKIKKICVFTGARAEYGLLKPLLHEIVLDKNLELQLLVTGMHLSPEFGLTYKIIENDGFLINEKIEMVISGDTPSSICKSIGLGLIGFADALNRLKPDFIVLLGDRYETLAGAIASLVSRIPIAHIQGGELTFGATDDSMRHSITKMSMLHFTYNKIYSQRVIQLGENPHNVFDVGALNVEAMKNIKLLKKDKFQKKIKFQLGAINCLVTFHPVTLEMNTAKKQFSALLNALKKNKNIYCIFTKTNSDVEGRVINDLIDEFVFENTKRSISFISMGQQLYFSAMNLVNVVIGNSSSGIIETPSFCVPTINIGDRQSGRIKAKNIIDCKPNEKDISICLKQALNTNFVNATKNMINPFEKKYTAKNIKNIIKDFDSGENIKKVFFDQ